VTTLHIPTFIPLAEHQRQVSALMARIAELEQRPLVAVPTDRTAELEAENATLKARIARVRALLKQQMTDEGRW